METAVSTSSNTANLKRNKSVIQRIISDKWLYIFLFPGLAYFLIFKYLPMWGVLISFENYQPFSGFFGSAWVGFKHFSRLFTEYTFWTLFRNTMIIGTYYLVFFFPAPIIISLMLNEIRVSKFKRIVQSLTYLPHFLSWVVIVGISYMMLTTEGGIINEILNSLGAGKINFLMDAKLFRPIIIAQMIWKETGWGTIIILAALTSVDLALYEASFMDGANRWQQLWHVTLPAIKSTIIILLLLRLGTFLENTQFEQIYLMLNAMNRDVGEVFDTYVYTSGIQQGNYSYSTAVGLFKSVVSLILVTVANYVTKKSGEEGIF